MNSPRKERKGFEKECGTIGCLGWLLLMPLTGAFWLAVTAANACAKRAGLWRLLGVVVSLVIGGICIQVGYWFAIEGFTEWQAEGIYKVTYPVLGWISMISGGLVALLGTWTAIVGTKEEIERREEMEKLDKERKEEERTWAKEQAKKMLEQGEIDDYEIFNRICYILDKTKITVDSEAFNLSWDLKELMKKQSKRQKEGRQ